jgi:YD repeat-containing protein
MMRPTLKVCALLATTVLASPALAQTPGSLAAPPVRSPVDENGVDVVRLIFSTGQTAVSIGGAGNHGLAYGQSFIGSFTPRDSFVGTLSQSGTVVTAGFGGSSDSFTVSGSSYVSTEGNGATLTHALGFYTYTNRNGVVVRFDDNSNVFYTFWDANLGRISDITYPDGTKVNYFYKIATYCRGGYEGGICQTPEVSVGRVQSITNSNGYQLKFTYANNDDPVATPANFHLWATVASVKAINNAVEYCNPNADSCTLTGSWPTATLGFTTGPTITDALGRTTSYPISVGGIYSIRRPGSTSDDVTWTLSGSTVASVTRDGVTYNYTFADAGNVRTTTVTDPNGKTRVYVGDKTTFRISSFKDELNRTTSYTYDSNQRIQRITLPEGNYVQYTYDARGNVKTTTNVAKAGSGLANIVTSAAFPSTCTNAKTCNKPTSTTDARGSVTNYTWDTNHGGVKTVTAPAATAGGIRPKVTYTYATKQAYYKQSAAGSPAASGINEYKLTQVDACQTLATYTGGSLSDQVKSTLAWGPQTAGTANNLLPVSVSSGNGTGTLTATTAYTYDNIGNRLTVDGPLTGTADITRYRYDAARQVVGIVGPDPDGAGIRKNLAQRITYNPQGQVTNLELGNVNSQSDPDWALFAPAQNVASTYDTHARLTLQQLQSGATTYAVTQTSYDSLGRLDCSAVRMNSALFGSLPASACTLGTPGTQGPDRISQRVYDDASELLQQKVAVGTADAATDTTYTYSSNGKVATLKDGENNLTTFVYDGFDRLSQTQFPNTPKGSGSSNPSDYEQLTYDPNGNVTNRRLRDGTNIAYTIDLLNRPTLKDLPGTEPDVTYGYDLLGRLLSASQTGSNLTFTYDALGRKLTEAGPLGTATSTWNLDGTRATLALPGGGITETYDRDVTGLVTKIRENGATTGIGVLATYTYDNLQRRTAVTNGNGTTSSYAFDAVSRLNSLTQNLAGTLNDLTVTISAYSPSSQIVTQSRSNDLYAWTGHGNGSTDTVTNGLNQLSTVGGVAATHDARGNLTSDPASGNSYAYSSENLLTSATVGGNAVTLAYDPLLRLTQVAGTATTKFGYDGLETLAEADGGGTILRRYAPGDGVDEPVVWYEGTGTADRRWLHADERGSVVAVSDASGNMLGINTYDEFGKPGAANIGRFQYTGRSGSASSASTTIRRGCTRQRSVGSCRPIRSAMARARTFTPMCVAIR